MRDNIPSSSSVTTTTATMSHISNIVSVASSSFAPSSTPPPPVTLPPPPLLTPFELTTLSLLKLGSLQMDRFVQNNPSEELEGFDIPLVDPANPYSYSLNRRLGDEEDPPGGPGDWENEVRHVTESEAVRYLRNVVHRIFGNNASMAAGAGKDVLHYEFIDELGDNRKCCILTIVRPNGSSRSYRTKPEFSRKSDAKLAAASLALRMGAVPFLRWGEESQRMKLAKLDAKPSEKNYDGANKSGGEEAFAEGERAVLQIENCCTEWRAGSVIPQWIYIAEPKQQNAFGCAVKITLSPHVQKTYSVLPSADYHRKAIAKAACAKLAVEEGILEFIKHGDGSERPLESLPGGGIVGGSEGVLPTPSGPVTLQAFFAALPKPMPEEIGTKSNGEINAVAWLNNMVQFAKGSRMTTAFHWHTDVKVGLHGCLLRLSRPDAPSQSYLVDAVFSKRGDAKLAVCLYACSQGLGDFIRRVAAEVDARVTPLMRRQCMEDYMPQMGQALSRIRHGLRPDYQFACDLATFGCNMVIELPNPDVQTISAVVATPSTTDNHTMTAGDEVTKSTAPTTEPMSAESEGAASTVSAPAQPETQSPPAPVIRREWKVPLAYKSKSDARLAAICLAMEDGLMDFLRSRGRSEKERIDLNAEEARARMRALESVRRGRGGPTFGIGGGRGRFGMGRGGFVARGGFGGGAGRGIGRGGFNGNHGMGMNMGPMPFASFGGAMPVIPPHIGVGMGVGGMAPFMGMGMNPYYTYGGVPNPYGGMPYNSGYQNAPQVPATNSAHQPSPYPLPTGPQTRPAHYPGRFAGTNGINSYGSLAESSPTHSVSSYSSGTGKAPPTGPRGWRERQAIKERERAQEKGREREQENMRDEREHERTRVKEAGRDRGDAERSDTEEGVQDGEESSASKEEVRLSPPGPSKTSPAPTETKATDEFTPKAEASVGDLNANASSVRLEKEIVRDESARRSTSPMSMSMNSSRAASKARSIMEENEGSERDEIPEDGEIVMPKTRVVPGDDPTKKTRTKRRREPETDIENPEKRRKKSAEGEVSLVDKAGKPYLTSLYEYCAEHNLPRPQLFHETTDKSGVRVWLILGKERMEHCEVFPSLEAAEQRLARSVLAKLKGKNTPSFG